MICLTVRPLFAALFLTAVIGAAASPASAQQSAASPNGAATPNAAQSAAPRQATTVVARSYGVPVAGGGNQSHSYPQPNSQSLHYGGTTGFGYSGGVPLSPGFGGSVAPQPGFGYQQGVTLGPGFGAQTLQPINGSGSQTQRYGNDGLPTLPALPGYSNSGGFSNNGASPYDGGGFSNNGTAPYNGGGYVNNGTPMTGNQPALLGGYYFPSYCSQAAGSCTLPTVYSLYGSFPAYFYIGDNVGVTVLPTAPVTDYDSGYLPYDAPSYQVNNYNNYTVNNYYSSPAPSGGDSSQTQTPQIGAAAPAVTGYDAAFADIKNAWIAGNVDLLKKHLRDNDIKIAVSIKGKYSYSIASGDFATITKDAFDKLTTSSFEFTSIRKATGGDVTGYAKHVYLAGDNSDGTKRTIYLSFTLSKVKDQWYIISIDSSTEKMDDQNAASAGAHDQAALTPSASRSVPVGS